jgi:hypothetical protein
MPGLSREQIVSALERLDSLLSERGQHAQIYLVGGAVMAGGDVR